MKKFKIGAWIIGEPDNFPVKLLTLNMDGQGIESMGADGAMYETDLNESDREATPEEVGTALANAYADLAGHEHITEAHYDETTDTLRINDVPVYKDGIHIAIL